MVKTSEGRRLSSEPGLLAAMRRHPVLVLLPTLLGAGAGYGVANALPTTFSASAQVFLGSSNERAIFRQAGGGNDPTVLAQQAVDFMRALPVLQRAQSLLGT